jgi:hypothetical protein
MPQSRARTLMLGSVICAVVVAERERDVMLMLRKDCAASYALVVLVGS